MNRNLLIVGAGERGEQLREVAQSLGCFNKIRVVDERTGETQMQFAYVYLYPDSLLNGGDTIRGLYEEGFIPVNLPALPNERKECAEAYSFEVGM